MIEKIKLFPNHDFTGFDVLVVPTSGIAYEMNIYEFYQMFPKYKDKVMKHILDITDLYLKLEEVK